LSTNKIREEAGYQHPMRNPSLENGILRIGFIKMKGVKITRRLGKILYILSGNFSAQRGLFSQLQIPYRFPFCLHSSSLKNDLVSLLPGRPATVQGENPPCHETGSIGGQIDDKTYQLFDLTPAVKGRL